MSGQDDYPDDDFYDGDEEPGISRKKWIGAVLAAVIVGGFGIGIWYAYDQGVKKGVQLAPPIISADTSPVKEKPEDPGGMDIPKQVFSVLQSGDAPEKVEQLMPPPEDATPEEKTELTVTDAEKASDEDKLDNLVDEVTKDAAEAGAKVGEVVESTAEKVEETVSAATTTDEPATEEKVEEKTLNSKFKSMLSDVSHRVQDVKVEDKGTYFRLQVGAFSNRDSANQLCNDLKAQKQDCLVVRG